MNLTRPVVGITMLTVVPGCGEGVAVGELTGEAHQEIQSIQFPVTANPNVDPIWGAVTNAFWQSETAIGAPKYNTPALSMIVAYNDGTLDGIEYSSEGRTIPYGTSTLGYSYKASPAHDDWRYGNHLGPPDGWAVQWGDPAVAWSETDEGDPGMVCVAGLAVPDAMFPAGGIVETPANPGLGKALGGVCVYCALAREYSSEEGLEFIPYDCLFEGEGSQHHFYDGGNMASAGLEIYGVWLDNGISGDTSYVSKAAVWHLNPGKHPFKKLADPFPGIAVGVHPLIRTYVPRFPSAEGHVAIVAAPGPDGVYMNTFAEGAWGTPALVAPYAPANTFPGFPIPLQNFGQFRSGRGFDFDVAGDGEIRVLLHRFDGSGNPYIAGVQCDIDLVCVERPDWGTHPSIWPNGSAWEFRPLVKAAGGYDPNYPSRWKTVFMSTEGSPGSTDVVLWWAPDFDEDGFSPTLAEGLLPANSSTACPSSGTDYWGDYDDLISLRYFPETVWFATHTDSSAGCYSQTAYAGMHQHVSGFVTD